MVPTGVGGWVSGWVAGCLAGCLAGWRGGGVAGWLGWGWVVVVAWLMPVGVPDRRHGPVAAADGCFVCVHVLCPSWWLLRSEGSSRAVEGHVVGLLWLAFGLCRWVHFPSISNVYRFMRKLADH